MSLATACDDLAAEAAALRRLLDARCDLDADETTPFHGWRVRDSIGHMVTIDRLARLTLSDPQAYAHEVARFGDGTRAREDSPPLDTSFRRIAAYEDSRLGLLSWTQLLAAWDAGLADLRAAALAQPEEAKVDWFGRPMRPQTLLNARQMEVWGYGQEVFDLYAAVRPETDRLRNVAEFGVRTMGFCFANHGLPAPQVKPHLALTAPSGAIWTWNEPSAEQHIEGPAVDFCLVATQRRNVADTALAVTGEAAATWMRIAQCISGPPQAGPKPGERVPW